VPLRRCGYLVLGLLGFLASITVAAQKVVKKTYVNANNDYIQIDSNNCYQVDLTTASGDELSVEAIIDGEYKKDLVVNIEQEGQTILVNTGFQPNFIFPNDKLSAHKVVSIRLHITLPEYHDIRLYGTSSHVNATGNYKNLKVDLADGVCELRNIGENVQVKTQRGTIYLFTDKGDILATSAYGTVSGSSIPSGDSVYDLRSVEGDIHLKKTE